MSFGPDHCWYLERVGVLERPNFILNNSKETIKVGRKADNDKVIKSGLQVSRNHLQFIRSGSATDWENIRWSVLDLGGMNGTYVNREKIAKESVFALNSGDLIGVGCPDKVSTKKPTETYVYVIRPPKAFQADGEDQDRDEDADTDAGTATPPPPHQAHVEDDGEAPSSSSQQKRATGSKAAAGEPSTSRLAGDAYRSVSCSRGASAASAANDSANIITGSNRLSNISNIQSPSKDSRKEQNFRDSSGNNGKKDSKDSSKVRDSGGGGFKNIKGPHSSGGDKSTGSSRDLTGSRTLGSMSRTSHESSNSITSTGAKNCVASIHSTGSGPTQMKRKLDSPTEGDNDSRVKAKVRRSDYLLFEEGSSEDDVLASAGSVRPLSPASRFQTRRCGVKLPRLRLPRRVVGARLLPGGSRQIKEWITLSKSHFKDFCLEVRGLPPDGSRGKPLELDDSLSEESSSSSALMLTSSSEEEDEVDKEIALVGEEDIMHTLMESREDSPSFRNIFSPGLPAGSSDDEEEVPVRAYPARGRSNGTPSVAAAQSKSRSVGKRSRIRLPATSSSSSDDESSSSKSLIDRDHRASDADTYKGSEKSDKIKEEPRQFDYSYNDEDVVIIEDSDAEESYLSQSQSMLAAPSSGESSGDEEGILEKDKQEDRYEDVDELLRESPPLRDNDINDGAEDDADLSGVEDEDDVEILNSSQTELYNKIMEVAIKTEGVTAGVSSSPVKTPPKTIIEEESQSLFAEGLHDEDADLVQDILSTIGPLADANVVRNAIRKDSSLGSQRSYENIFQFVRADIEEVLACQIQSQVGCGKGLVRQCLADMKAENDDAVVEQINRQELLERVRKEYRLKTVLQEVAKATCEDVETVREMWEDMGMEDNEAAKEELILKVKKLKDRQSAEEGNLSDISLDGLDDDALAASAVDQFLPVKAVAVDSPAAALTDDANLSDVSVDDLICDAEEIVSTTAEPTKATATSNGISPSGNPSLCPSFSTNYSSIEKPRSGFLSEVVDKGNKTKLPEGHRVAWLAAFGGGVSGRPQLIEPLAQPSRRANQRGISANTVDRLKAVETEKRNAAQDRKVGGTSGAKYAGMFAKRYPQVERQLSREDQVEERRRRLKDLAEKQKQPEKEKNKLLAPAVKMKSSLPRSSKLLEEMQKSSGSRPTARKTAAEATAGSRPHSAMLKYQDSPRQRRPSERRSSESGESCISSASAPAFGTSGDGNENGLPPRRPSLGFLDEEAQLDTEKLRQKKEKFKATADGYQVPKKLSVQNVDYNVCSQDISKMKITTKPLVIPGITPRVVPAAVAKKSATRRISWRDQILPGSSLVDIREIERNNKGKKISGKDADTPPPSTTNKLPRDVTTDDFLRTVLSWAPSWLREQKNNIVPPKVHGKWEVLPLPDTFSSWEEYRKIFMPLMLHELWALVSKDTDDKEEACREEVLPVFIQSAIDEPQRRRIFHACAVITEQESRRDLATDGTLVILNLSFTRKVEAGLVDSETKQPKEIRPFFGYVRRAAREPLYHPPPGTLRTDSDKACIAALEKESARSEHRRQLAYLVRYTIETKWAPNVPERSLCVTKPIIMKVLSRIKPELRKVQALLELNKSALFTSITSPDLRSLGATMGNENLHPAIMDIPQVKMLNSTQKKIIVGVSRAFLDDPKAPKIALVQGPPGTGKSATIVGMILQIWSARSKVAGCGPPRILVVAPSNAAVDELALKLIAARSAMPDKKQFQILRLGVTSSIHPEVVPYTYDAVLRRLIDADTRKAKAAESLEADERNKQQRANKLYDEKMAAEKRGDMDLANKLDRDYKDTMKEKEKIREALNRPLERRKRQELAAAAELRVMTGADIFLSTLSSSTVQPMEAYFLPTAASLPRTAHEQFRPISICIMDEASQCVEPEALIPFKYGFNKLVMVGDPAQLPATVLSQTAKKQDYHQSLFKRLFKIFSSGIGPDGKVLRTDIPGLVRGSVMKLDTQYRMHTEIGDWPSRYFYGGLLTAGEQERKSALAPYTILDLESVESAAKGGLWNKAEERLAVDTAEVVRKVLNQTATIGIITFYAKQKQNIHLEVQNRRLQAHVNVNTVDGYQGSERDVIIMSCVRAGGKSIGFLEDSARLNVGLTRAKQALIIIGNMHTLGKGSGMWSELLRNASDRGTVFKAGLGMDLEKVLSVNRAPCTGQPSKK